MKVLVIDDTQVHLTAAKQTLVGHDVTVCSTHDEAAELTTIQLDEDRFEDLCMKYLKEGMNCRAAVDKASAETRHPYWDVVLCDLLMPAGSMNQGTEGAKFVGLEMPVGWSLALKAVKNGAKYVAVVTDTNHHDHPASAMLDALNVHIFAIDGAKMLLTNRPNLVGITGTECPCELCEGTGKQGFPDGSLSDCSFCKNGVDFTQKGKDWGAVLKKLTG